MVYAFESFSELRQADLIPDLLACGDAELFDALAYLRTRQPFGHVITWLHKASDDVFAIAAEQPRLCSILGWPSFASMPRPWELSMVARRLLDVRSQSPHPGSLALWGASERTWSPQTTEELHDVVEQAEGFVQGFGGSERSARNVASIAHELLMNAMYDAPVDAQGTPRFAGDRRQEVVLAADEAPGLSIALDGVSLVVQVIDPFGGLKRERLFSALMRGQQRDESPDAFLDSSAGGAGLGLISVLDLSSAVIVEVAPQRQTKITSVIDLDIGARELRRMPKSVHYFER
jgi:hypothetical protein